MATYGSKTIQVPATESYSSSGGIAAYSANSSATLTSSDQGQAGGSYTILWQYSLDNAENDGFTGSGWYTSTGPFSTSSYANDSDDEVMTAIQNGYLTSSDISNFIDDWVNANESTRNIIYTFLGGLPNNCLG